MIDENKLLEELKELKHGTEIALDMACGELDIECFKNWIYTYEKIIKLIEKQPKISLENKTSDNMNSSCSGHVWIPCEGCKDCKHKECKNYGKI